MLTSLKYNIVLADCPWRYADQKNNDPAMGGITYPTMTVEELSNLDVASIAAKDSLLFMWATMPLLPEAITVMRAWGFTYITCAFTWIKLNPTGQCINNDKDIILEKGIYSGLGHWTNGNAELCLLGKRGKPKRQSKSVKQIIIAPRSRHSAKPPIYDRIIALAGDLPRVELFARHKEPGWDAFGNEIESDVLLSTKNAQE